MTINNFSRDSDSEVRTDESSKYHNVYKMAPALSEDEIDDLLYFGRTGDKEEYETLKNELCKRENLNVAELLIAARDEASGNGILHMAAANGHHGISIHPSSSAHTYIHTYNPKLFY